MKRALMAVLALTLGLLTGLAAAESLRLPAMGDPAGQHLSQTQERELGRELIRQVRQHLPLLDDPEVNAYIRDLGRRLASHSDAPEQEFHFFVVDHQAINAFAMPGGYIGINTGLILNARSESELAGVMAHEIAHVTQRHIARRLADAQRTNLRTTALILASIIIASQDPQAGSAAAMAGVAGSIQQQLNFSREHEHEADRIGMRILAAAGFDPMGMPNFFDRLLTASQYRNQPPEWLSTHPLTAARIADTQSRAQGLAGKREVFESRNFALMQARLKVLSSRTPEEAAAFFRSALDEDNGSAGRYGLALALTASRDFAGAEELLQGLIEQHGEEASFLLALADLELRRGDLDASLARYQEVASLYPHNVAAHINHAQALLRAERPEKARQLLNRALRQGEPDPQLYWLLAQAANASGQPAEARLAMAEHYYLEGDLQAALTQLRQVIDGRDADPHQVARASSRADSLRAALRQRQSAP